MIVENRSGSKSILFPWNIIRMTIPMQTRLNQLRWDMHRERDIPRIKIASPPKLHSLIVNLEVSSTLFGICAEGRCHLRQRVVPRRLLSRCDNDPRFRETGRRKREGQRIVNKQVRSLQSQRRSPTRIRLVLPSHACTLPLSANEHSY